MRARGFAVAAFLLSGTIAACGAPAEAPLDQDAFESIQVLSPDAVEFVPLNPARGDASPQAGVLWGDIRENVPSGAFLRFAEGFSSPPHIHTPTVRL